MGRLPRPLFRDGAYHVTARAGWRRLLFRDDADREIFLAILTRVAREHGWVVYALCLMGTHYHLVVLTPRGDLDAGLHRLNGHYARTFNRRHGGRGHVFEGRYCAEVIQTEAHLLESIRYVALNPVRAALVRRPEEWPWSSYATVLGRGRRMPFVAVAALLRLFDGTLRARRDQLRRFVEGRLGRRAA